MSETPEGASVELIVALNRLNDRIEAMNRPGANQTVTLSAGGFGVWVSGLCALVCFLMFCVILTLWVNHDRKIDDVNHIISAIYMISPEIKEIIQDGNPNHSDPAADSKPAAASGAAAPGSAGSSTQAAKRELK